MIPAVHEKQNPLLLELHVCSEAFMESSNFVEKLLLEVSLSALFVCRNSGELFSVYIFICLAFFIIFSGLVNTGSWPNRLI